MIANVYHVKDNVPRAVYSCQGRGYVAPYGPIVACFKHQVTNWVTRPGALHCNNEHLVHIYGVGIDDEFVRERTQTLSIIKQQLEDRHLKEALLEQEIKNLSGSKKSLEQIDTEYVTMIRAIKTRKNREAKRLYRIMDSLKLEQEKVIQMKTGFFRGISRKNREQKEIEIGQEIDTKQRELELVVLDFNGRQKELRDEYEIRREPMLEQIKKFKKLSQNLETDGSLEERWFACEALVDSVITFLQRKATKLSLGSN